jgi:pSer/pThr/pTyr-binding forkhead associated (FHA) protein
MTKIVFTDGPFEGRIYELALERTTVGRGDQNALVIRDESVSLAHCEILVYGPEVIIRDIGSRNGTTVIGTKLQNAQAQLKDGQTICFGSVRARLELEDESEDFDTGDFTAIHLHVRALRENAPKELIGRPA